MQQFTVPQFIDVEDKIFGPITTRQFIIILVGCILIGICYKIFDFTLFLTCGVIILAISVVLAFVRINGRPFHFFILNALQTLKRPHLRAWNQFSVRGGETQDNGEGKVVKTIAELPVRHYSASRLAELSLIVDTKGEYKGEEKESELKIESIN